MIGVRIKNLSNNPLPKYETAGSSGMDIRAFLKSPVTLKPGERLAIPTGLYFDIPDGFEFQVRPRSGLALKYGVTVLNTPGTIDCDYTGELKVILINHGETEFTINSGERIAQIVASKVERVTLEETSGITKITERGDGGFGHTGDK